MFAAHGLRVTGEGRGCVCESSLAGFVHACIHAASSLSLMPGLRWLPPIILMDPSSFGLSHPPELPKSEFSSFWEALSLLSYPPHS